MRLLLLLCLWVSLTLPGWAAPLPAADRPESWLPLLAGKRLGVVVNPSSRVGTTHLVDFLRRQNLKLQTIFAPEHGFRGTADAGAHLDDGLDAATGLPVVSLYGAQKKPSAAHLADLDALVFDIQDVGVRYYTYISTLHYVLEAAAEAGQEVIVLDRPNPNGGYVDGPVLDPALRSFVGMHPIPLVYGLTIGELARMIQGEAWIEHAQQLKLTVVAMAGYRHDQVYSLPVRPSPNLPNDRAIRLYPSLGLFEGTPVSVGRGTDWPFQVLGLPDPRAGAFSFTPRSLPGATSPPYLGQTCYGLDLRQGDPPRFSLRFLLHFYKLHAGPEPFFKPFFDKLAGTGRLRHQIEAGLDEAAIRASWQPELRAYASLRSKYLLYP